MEKDNKTQLLRFRIEPELKQEFVDICNERCIQQSALMRQWIMDFVKKHKRLENQDIGL